jgi:plastocyanin
LVVLGLCADVLAWMAPAAVTNVAHGEGLVAVAVPLALTLGALVSCAAAVCDLLRHRGHSAGGRPVMIAVAGAGVAAFVAGLAVAQLGLFGDPVRARPGDVVLGMRAARFAKDVIRVRAGTIGVVVDNADLFWHTFTIDALHVDTRVPVQARRRVTFQAAPGTYTYYCAIPGHRTIGMEGTLTVTP